MIMLIPPAIISVEIQTTGISCQLTEWSLAGSETVVYTQAVTSVRPPDLRLNVNAVTVTESLYRGVSHSVRGIRLLNNTHYDFVYSWGNPMGTHAGNADCAFKPANGTVCAGSFVEFEFIVTPKTSVRPRCYNTRCVRKNTGIYFIAKDQNDKHVFETSVPRSIRRPESRACTCRLSKWFWKSSSLSRFGVICPLRLVLMFGNEKLSVVFDLYFK